MTRRVRRITARFLFVAVVAFPLQAVSGEPSVEEQIARIIQIRDLLLQRQYDSAEARLKKVVADWPGELVGYFGLMALYQIRNLDNYDFRFDSAYLQWEEKGRTMALKVARYPLRNAAWDLLMAGGTLGVSGFYRAHNGRWFAGLRDASLGFHTIQKAYAKDEGLTDALLGMGLYDYWRSHFTRKLHFLPFFADRRPHGKAMLERVVKEARFTGVMAEIGLAFIDYQEKNYEKAIGTMDRFLKKYPRNTILRMLRGDCLIRLKKFQEAVAEFEGILRYDPHITKSHYFIGLALAREGTDKERARASLERFLQLEPEATAEWKGMAQKVLRGIAKD